MGEREKGGRGKGEGEGVLSGPFYAPLASLTSLHQHIYVYIQSDYLFILFGSFSVDIIRAFKACKRDHPTLQFLGACNALKLTLNRCLKEQKVGYPIGVE